MEIVASPYSNDVELNYAYSFESANRMVLKFADFIRSIDKQSPKFLYIDTMGFELTKTPPNKSQNFLLESYRCLYEALNLNVDKNRDKTGESTYLKRTFLDVIIQFTKFGEYLASTKLFTQVFIKSV